MNKTVSSSFNKSDNSLSVTLYSNSLTKDGEMIGKVTRNTVTLENMIAAISEENHGLDPYVIQHSAILLQQQMLKMLQLGKAVNMLDLGVIYIGIKGCIKGENPGSADIPDFIIRFTPSSLANETLKSLQVDKVVLADSNPHINSVLNTWNNQENTVTAGKICRITGDRLKLGGDFYSLSFIPLEEDGAESESLPQVAVDFNRLIKNTSGNLEFYVPETLEPSRKYAIRVTTSYVTSNLSRKTPVTVTSNQVVVIA